MNLRDAIHGLVGYVIGVNSSARSEVYEPNDEAGCTDGVGRLSLGGDYPCPGGCRTLHPRE